MGSVMSGLQGVGGILDGLILTGYNDERHLSNLESALERISGMEIKLKKEKCIFMKPTVEYLAFVVNRNDLPLTYILGPKRGIPALAASRLQRWSIQLAAYTYDIEYRASKYHGNADALSRLPGKTTEEADDWSMEGDQVNRVQIKRTPITASRIREATRGDPVLSCVLHFVLYDWPAEENTLEELRYYRAKREEFTVEDGCLLRGTRVVIPSKYQQEVLSELHLNHPGMARMKSLARLHVWWPNLDSDIEQTVRDCPDCQANRCKTPLKVNNPWL
ncbi:uncharacterized protein K02A2.6-like [Acropora millepora]|uniref:uncharacterized protein K02A2.6-like n=1 Tax=Acropora millepora TaxID=45264 RepID=UPI001CF378AA|nr:uncharacterized protein K02A2.6-like [Acropora millepora]